MTGDMKALAELIERVQVGTFLQSVGYDANTGESFGHVTHVSDDLYRSGRAGIIHTLNKPVRNQGRTFTSGYLMWPQEGDDFEIDGDTLKMFNPSHPYVGGRRAIVSKVTFTFVPPQS